MIMRVIHKIEGVASADNWFLFSVYLSLGAFLVAKVTIVEEDLVH